MQLTTSQRRIFFNCFRQMLYFIFSLGFVFFLRVLSAFYRDKTFLEHGIVENLQLLLLSLGAFSFLFQGLINKKFRPLLYAFSSLFLFALCRELDSFFEKNIFFIGWKFAYLFPLLSGIYLYTKRKRLKNILLLFCTSPVFYMMCTAMFIFIPLAQAIGNRGFIASVLPDASDVILMRRFIEESGEIMAYFILLLSSLEFYISFIYKSKKSIFQKLLTK